MAFSSEYRDRKKSVVIFLLYFSLLLLGSTAQAKPQSVQDLRYGVTLYHFYQQDYFQALTELMVAEELEQLPNHQANAELLKGGMSLSYGLDKRAEGIFTRLLSEPVEGVDQNKAWFYLSKLQYQRGDVNSAEVSLQKIDGALPVSLAEEAIYMKSRLAMGQGDVATADKLASHLSQESVWLPYYYYNLGVIETASGRPALGVDAFRNLQALPINTAEEKALRDRAYTAAGFASMAAGKLDQARAEFSKVRIDSPLVDRALLGYGWAFAQEKDYRSALSPWQKLSQRSMLSPSVQESLLAIPFAYETLGAPAGALKEYQKAVIAYQQEIQRIDAAIQTFQHQDLGALFNLSSSESDEWLVGGEILPLNKQAPYLSHLFSSNSFQGAIKDFRDLSRLYRYLRQAEERLGVLTAVDLEQQALWHEVIEQSRLDELAVRHRELSLRREQMKNLLAKAASENDGRRLADEKQLSIWKMIEQARVRVERLAQAGEDVSGEQNLLRLYSGMMQWNDSEAYPDRLWQHKKSLREVAAQGEETLSYLQRIQDLVDARKSSDFTPRIVQLDTQVQSYQLEVSNRLQSAEQAIRQLAIAELDKQQRRLSYYLSQAKLAVARLYDRGSIEARP